MNRIVGIIVFIVWAVLPAAVAAGASNKDDAACRRLPPIEINFPGTPLFGFAWRGETPTDAQRMAYSAACATALDAHPEDTGLLLRLAALTFPIDPDTALFLIEQAAAKKAPAAQTILGLRRILTGDDKAGRRLIGVAAQQGHGEALWLMGYLAQGILKPPGKGDPPSLGLFAAGKDKTPPKAAQAALGWYQKAVAGGYAKARGDIGILYFRNSAAFGKTPKEAVALMTDGAVAGNLMAQSVLGTGYLAGVPPFKPDTETATLWLKRASDGGSSAAGFLLVNLYLTGKFFGGEEIVPVDAERARLVACRHPQDTDAVYEAYAGKKLVCAAP